ncbi:MAG: hypothetical protein KDD53_12130, partial [Bdellovibrionales bacterium]|nr:hypothetical protein [Bdellovibrionales bacterium]
TALVMIPLLAVTIVVILSKQREFILENIWKLSSLVIWSVFLYLFCYIFGWFFGRRSLASNRVAYLFCSGCNNLALGIVISFLYFPKEVSAFLVLSEFSWVSSMAVVTSLLGRQMRAP